MKLYHTVSIHTLYATTSCNRFSSNILNSFYFRRSCLIFVRDLRVWLYYKKYIIYQTIHAWIVSLVCEPWLFTPDFKSHLKLCLEFRIRRTDHQSKWTELLGQVLGTWVYRCESLPSVCLPAGELAWACCICWAAWVLNALGNDAEKQIDTPVMVSLVTKIKNLKNVHWFITN